MDTQDMSGPCCFNSSAITGSSLDPNESKRIDSVDLSIATRRMSEQPAGQADEAVKTALSRSASMATEARAIRSDSLPEIVVVPKDSF